MTEENEWDESRSRRTVAGWGQSERLRWDLGGEREQLAQTRQLREGGRDVDLIR